MNNHGPTSNALSTFEPDDDNAPRLEDRLCDHWVRNPDAADTAWGIANSWLLELGTGVSEAHVAKALAALVQRGFLRAHRLPDGGVLYRKAPRAEALLHKHDPLKAIGEHDE